MVIPLIVVSALWEVVIRTGLIGSSFFPPPTEILKTLWQQITDGAVGPALLVSLKRVALAFVIGTVPAVIFGCLMGYFPFFYRIVDPLVAVTYPVPKLAILPLLLVIFGLGSAPIIVMAAILCFYPTLVSTIAGVRGVDRNLIDVVRSLGGSRIQVARKVILPGALPVMFAGFRLGVGIALEGEIAAEFVSSSDGIGAQTWNFWQVYQIDKMYANLVVIAIVGLAITYLVKWTEEVSVKGRRT
jgi:NitT/TauT family transport system permease protein